MHRNLHFATLALLAGTLLAVCLPLEAAKFHRWKDSDGNIHYSDKLPPEASDKARTLIDDRGISIETVEAARTPEEIARDQELKRMRAEQQRLIEEQKAADRVLLRTFRSEDDIKMTVNGKLTAIDVQILVIRSNIKRLKQKLANLQKEAASLERRGKPIPKNLFQGIENTRSSLKEGYAAIIRNEKQKEHYRKAYNKDLERFLALKHLRPNKDVLLVKARRNLILDHLYPCKDESSCNAAWQQAETFVESYATTNIQMLSDTIIMTAPPVKDNDISITIARIRPKQRTDEGPTNDTHLFMDLQCKHSPRGIDFCASKKIDAIRSGFKLYLAGKTVSVPE